MLINHKLELTLESNFYHNSRFQNVILPNQNARLRYFTMRRPIFIPLQHQKLTDKIEWIVSKLFT